MKKALVIAAVLLTQFSLEAQQDLRGTAELTLKGKKVSIEYGRPSLRGRDMLGMAKPEMVWRMGMNAPTTMKTEANLVSGDVSIPAGDYKLQAKCVGTDQWELLLNGGELVVPFKTEVVDANVETFTIYLLRSRYGQDTGGARLRADWGNKRLTVEFKVSD